MLQAVLASCFVWSLVWRAYNKQQDKKRALAYMCRRFDLNDTFHDVGRMQKVVEIERP